MTGTAVLSIDVEDWFQVENLKSVVARETWTMRQLRVERNVDRMLELMDDAGVTSTCFVLGWIADRCPALVRRIAEAGHEVASHGYGHELLAGLTRDEFRADVYRSKSVLEELTGRPVFGYRAPAFSITAWAIPILQELGFTYDSSAFPAVAHERYGRLEGIDARRTIAELRPGFHEVSPSCLPIGARGLPWGGGGYFRLIPYAAFRLGIITTLRRGQPYVFYIHPWEIDPDQPRLRGLPRGLAFRHYVGLRACELRFTRLLSEFRWSTVHEVVDASRRQEAIPAAAVATSPAA